MRRMLAGVAALALSALIPISADAVAADDGPVLGCGVDPRRGAHPDHPTIAYGSRGPDVEEAQCRLSRNWNQHGIKSADGIFGSQTRTAVVSVQTWCRALGRSDIVVDGIVGPKTWALIHDPRPGDTDPPCFQ